LYYLLVCYLSIKTNVNSNCFDAEYYGGTKIFNKDFFSTLPIGNIREQFIAEILKIK